MNILVTGASSGFGMAITRKFIQNGHKVIGVARRAERLEALHAELGEAFHPLPLDIRNRVGVCQILDVLPLSFKEVDVLVNNAGLALGLDPAHRAGFDDWVTMVDTNIIGLLSMVHTLIPHFVKRNHGHIINIGSIAGTYPYPSGNVYGATKAFVKQFSLNLRADLAGTQVRVSNVEPGLCGTTEFSKVRFKGDSARANQLYENVQPLTAENIADVVYWVASQPEHVNVNTIEVMPVAQSFSALNVVRNRE